MKDTYNLSKFGSLRRARQIAVTLLFALTLAGLLASMAATPQLTSFDLSKSTMVRNGNDSITATVTISCPPGYAGYEWGPALTSANGFVLMPSGVAVYCGDASTATSAPFSIYPDVVGGTLPQEGGRVSGTCEKMNNLTQRRKDAKKRKEELLCLLRDALRLCVSCFLFSPIFSRLPDTLPAYEEQLTPPGSQSLIYWRGDGSAWTFTYNSVLNSYSLTSPPDERAQLVSNLTGGFTLTLADGTQKVFNGQNLLAALIDRNHNQTTLAYDSSNRLTSVTSAGGSTLTFTYGNPNNPSQATTAQDSVGTVATYTYDSSSRLTQVTYPDGSALNFSIDPYSSMILSVTDSQGKLLESHTYDAQGRGLTSARAYGVDSVSLSY